MRDVVVVVVTLAALSLASSIGAVAQVVTIPDAALQQAIREELRKPTGDLTATDMDGLLYLNASDLGITSLDGLEFAKS